MRSLLLSCWSRGLAHSFRDLVHDHHSKEHGNSQTGPEAEVQICILIPKQKEAEKAQAGVNLGNFKPNPNLTSRVNHLGPVINLLCDVKCPPQNLQRVGTESFGVGVS